MNPIIKQIRSLISKDPDRLPQSCREILDINRPTVTSIEIPLKNTRDIYYRRASWNAEQAGDIIGFDDLIPRLERETRDSVAIHDIQADGRWLVVFTDSDVTDIIGILCKGRPEGS